MENLDPQTINLITIGAEILAIVVLFFVLGWVLGRILGLLENVKGISGGVQLVRRNLRFLLIVLGFLACLAVGGGNAYLMMEGEYLPDYTRELVQRVPREVWIGIAIGLGKGLALFAVVAFCLRYLRRLLASISQRAQDFDGIKANDESVQQFFGALTKMLSRGTWIAAWAVFAGWVGLPESAVAGIWTLLRIYLIVSGGLLVIRALDALIDSLDAWSRRFARPGSWLAYYEQLSHLVPLFRRTLEYVLYVVVATLVVAQIEAVADLADWGPKLIGILGILFLARVAIEVVNLLVDEVLIKRAALDKDAMQRRLTIVPLIKSGAKYAIYFTAGIVILKQLEIDPTPILAGAGIVTLAIGLGAQNLINDVVSGFFILFENYYLVGDYVAVNGSEGIVEQIDIRATRIRDNEGRLHIVRNGEVEDLINFSKDYTLAVLEVGVAYESDLKAVFEAFGEIGGRLEEQTSDTLGSLEVRGLKAFGESELTVRVQIRVKPGKHLDVEYVLRGLVWEVFEERGIEIPYARRVVIFKPEAGGDPGALGESAESGPGAGEPDPVRGAGA